MCGIVGKVKLNGTVVASDVIRMCDQLTHRGPDDAGSYIAPTEHVGLGHRRLSILDLTSAGHQPMSYKQRYWIVFNGEIYNFIELRRQLEHQGHKFTSQTDTEVILAMYDQHGAGCVHYLRGMFAFVIYDEQRNVLFGARDRVGQKPLKYYWDGQTFIFASELKAILTQNEYQSKPDYLAIHHYLTYQYVPAPLTGFVGINKLLPAHYFRLDVGRRNLEIKPYWQLDFSKTEQVPESEWQARIRRKLTEAVTMQMIADVPVGAFLSGGVDSSVIVALMAPQATGRLKTFSIGFPDQSLNELTYARQVADHFKTDHTELIVQPSAIEILPDLVAAFEEPYADSSAIPTYYLSKLARQQVTVALNGDGGDENFAGYARYNFHKLALLLSAWRLHRAPGLPNFAKWLASHSQSTLTMRAARFLESLPEPALRRYVTYGCYFTNAMKQELYQPAFVSRIASHNSYDVITTTAGATPFDQALAADISLYLPDDLLVKVDMATMLTSLEARSPFLDHEFLELTARIPSQLKLRGWRHNKYIFKETFRQDLPPGIINRPKMGFVAPIERWFRGDLRSYLRSHLLAPQAHITRDICRPEVIKSLIAQHATTSTNLAPPLWALLTLELWFRRYFP